MRKYRYYSAFQKALSALLCLSMVLSMVTGTDLQELFRITENVNAEESVPDMSEYADETLENMWDSNKDGKPDDTFLAAARPYYTCRNGSYGGVEYRTIFHVYAFEGDTICVGSSVFNSTLDINHVSGKYDSGTSEKGSTDVVMTDLNGNTRAIDIRNSKATDETEKNTTGYIGNWQTEWAAVKYLEKKDGKFSGTYTDGKDTYTYTPYTYTVTETGVYTFEFHSYNKSGTVNDKNGHEKRSDDFNDPTVTNNYGGQIAAINLTVFDESGEEQHGRTYADFLSLQMHQVGKGVVDTYYILTTDSYIYKMKFNNIMPYTYNFFVNNTGIYDTATNEIIYKSVKATGNHLGNTDAIPEMGAYFKYPGTKDTELSKSYYIFLEYPDDDLYGHLYERAVQPDPATNIRFVDKIEYEGKEVPGSYVGVGGYFAFDVEEATTATLRLEFVKLNNSSGTSGTSLSPPLIMNKKSFPESDTSEPATETTDNSSESSSGEESIGSILLSQSEPIEETTLSKPEPDISVTTTEISSETTDSITTIASESSPAEETTSTFPEITEPEETTTSEADNINIMSANQKLAKEVAPSYVYTPVEISGVVTPHTTNYFYWDGCDGNGTPIPPGEYTLEDIVFTVTTKAGEIHFPITDMETAPGGITYTRMSHIYDKSGKQLDSDTNIYGLTKNLIYYDDSAIYYGENIASVGISENQVDTWISGTKAQDSKGRTYRIYDNMKENAGEYNARQSQYIKDNPDIKIGDHSHLTNIVDYFDSDGNVLESTSQAEMIKYLNSDTYPVGLSTGGTTTTDYGIANYWTFIPSKPEHSTNTEQTITIVEEDSPHFNLIGRVFYDADNPTNGLGYFSDMNTTGEYLMNGVTVNLYKKVTSGGYNSEKTYVNSSGETLSESTFSGGTDAYELIKTGKTSNGSYTFSGLEYNKDTETEYLYQVITPNPSYTLTTYEMKAAGNSTTNTAYYYYANYTYNQTYTGTEIQKIIVGGTDGIDPTKKFGKTTGNPNHTVCAVDVGYHYEILPRSMMLKKTWEVPEDPTTHVADHPNSVVYEVDYKSQSGTGVYAFRTMSAITSWQYEDEYLPTTFNGSEVEDYYVAAEYYIEDGIIYRHTFNYDATSQKYHSFVGKVESAELSALSELVGDTVQNFSNVPDLNVLTELKWNPVTEKYRAVLDRNISSDSTTVTITNSQQHGTIEIFKYSGENKEENALQGATFRVYELGDSETLETIKQYVSNGNTTELRKRQVGSATTRVNGRVAFPGLDPTGNYVVREVYPPAGYRILNEFYEVKSQSADLPDKAAENFIYKFDNNNYVKVDVGNAPADSNFYILKRIEGRTWQSNDSFSFTIKNPFDKSKADGNISAAEGIQIDIKELGIFGIEPTDALTKAEEFANQFKGSGSANKITVNDRNDYYSYEAEDIHNTGETVTYTYPDRKMSNKLLTDGKGTDEGNPTFCGVEFPMAGVYTFTITENDIESTAKDTLKKSPLEYTITITVNRVRNTETDATEELSTTNSHLEAEVSSITYKDTSVSDSISQIFAGSSPLFTNTYAPAPAKQDTSYKIVKEFTGRTGDEWLTTDEFTVRVSGVNTETQEAIKNGNLAIAGFNAGELMSSGSTSEWMHKFTKGDHTAWNFNSFTFNDIMFPVQYVHPDGTVWEPTDPNQTVPTQDDITAKGLKPQTIPVTYWLKIAEDIPEETNGITYDDKVYYLQIILRNAEAKVGNATEEEDGIIDEIDMKLYHVDKSMTDIAEIEKQSSVATCNTIAEVLDITQWKDTPTGDIKEYAWFLVNKDNTLTKVSDGAVPTENPSGDYKLLVRRRETHGGDENGHTMTFSNIYHTSYSWSPQVKKTLNGREWGESDAFTFTLECKKAPDGVDVSSFDKTITITKSDPDFRKAFSEIKFTVPGDYEFKITESSVASNLTTTVKDDTSGTYIITVEFKDNNTGALTPTFNGYDASTGINFMNVYSDNAQYFDLNISKQIVGRDWNDADEFTFKITPDDVTKKAIDEKYLEMPADLTKNSDGSYTVTVQKDSTETTIADTVTKSLGTIKILKGTESGAEYHFDIEESDIPENMRCREPNIKLTINVNRVLDTEHSLPTGDLSVSATFAYMSESGSAGTTGDPTKSSITIPFVNECMGKLTVAKKVVSNAQKDTTPFTFEVKFTCEDGFDTKNMTATHSTTGKEVTSADKKTYTFTLTDGESVVFDKIPPYTEYTITEIDDPTDKYVLLRARNHKSDDGEMIHLEDNSLSGKIDGTNAVHYRLFVNGLIKELPSGGDVGIEGYIFYGTVLTVGSVVLIAVLYFKRRKRRELEE